MPEAELGKALDPKRPWPTLPQKSERIIRLMAGIAAFQFVLNAVAFYAERWLMAGLWLFAAAVVALATIHIERHFFKRARMEKA